MPMIEVSQETYDDLVGDGAWLTPLTLDEWLAGLVNLLSKWRPLDPRDPTRRHGPDAYQGCDGNRLAYLEGCVIDLLDKVEPPPFDERYDAWQAAVVDEAERVAIQTEPPSVWTWLKHPVV